MASPQITVTEKAAAMVAKYAADQNADGTLRVGIRGGGCSGFKYQLAFDHPRDTDHVFQAHGIKVLVDPEHLPYLDGSTVDFIDGLQGAGFEVSNPRAVAQCGCGGSFRLADESCDGAPSAEDVYL